MTLKFPHAAFAAAVALTVAGSAAAQVELLFDRASREGPVVVTAERAVFERGTGITRFTGGVLVTHDTLRLTCEQAQVKTSETDESQIEYVRVTGNVALVSEDSKATAGWGLYELQEGKIRLFEGVRVETPAFTLSGPTFVYDIETGLGTLEQRSAADIQISDE